MMDIVKQAVDLLKERAYFSVNVDWDSLAAQIADLPPDDAILKAVTALNDHHSFYITAASKATQGPAGKSVGYGAYIVAPDFVVTEVCPQSAADNAGLVVGDVVEQVNGTAPSANGTRLILDSEKPVRLTIRRGEQHFEAEMTAAPVDRMPLPYGRMVGEKIGYVALFAHGDPNYHEAYIDAAQTAIREGVAAGAKAWIVDLRRDRGGNMWTMFTGIGALMGDGLLGSFVTHDGNRTQWLHQNGVSLYQQDSDPEPVEFMRASDPLPTFDVNTTPVAILTSALTDSAGEMTLIALLGRPNSRTFGEATTGDITGVAIHELEDGSLLGIAESVAVDRTGRTYASSIQPAEPVAVDWLKLNADDDPVVAAAVKWLRQVKADLTPNPSPYLR